MTKMPRVNTSIDVPDVGVGLTCDKCGDIVAGPVLNIWHDNEHAITLCPRCVAIASQKLHTYRAQPGPFIRVF